MKFVVNNRIMIQTLIVHPILVLEHNVIMLFIICYLIVRIEIQLIV